MPDSFQSPIGGGSKDPFEKYRIEEIQKDKDAEDAEKKLNWSSQTRRSLFATYMILIFKKFLDIFDQTTERGLGASAEIDVREHLALFKATFETLKIEDHSQDIAFLNRLSLLWHQLLEDVLRFRRKTPLADQMHAFIKSIKSYPANQEHSLAYYLSEYAGQKWLPFPYMEMLQQLWREHQKNLESSNLYQWSEDLEKMIQILNPEQKPS
jgi:hypothetical protein